MKREANIDYNGLFKHVEDLKKILLVAGAGRVGSDFFQSLLDSHSEILQFTGVWFFHQWWVEAKCKKNLEDLINEFIWHTCNFCNHIAKFKSYCIKRERWHQLGDNKNEFFEVDIDTFRNHMLNILVDKKISSRNFFLAVNLAYGLATDVKVEKTKILFYHTHHIKKLKDFKQDFPDFDVICAIREPRNALVSAVEHWRRYDSKTYNPNFFYQALSRIFEESEPILRYTKNCNTSKLEDLHLFSEKILRKFCEMYNLQLEPCMFMSSYHGKKWWGDELSDRYLDGFNKNINDKKWKDKLYFYDNFLIEFILEDRLKHYEYPFENKIPKFCLLLAIFLIFLPIKYEVKIFIDNFSNEKTIKGKSISIKNSAKFYILRILLYFKFVWKKCSKKVFLVNFLGQKKAVSK